MGFPDWLIWCFAYSKEISYGIGVLLAVAFFASIAWFIWRA